MSLAGEIRGLCHALGIRLNKDAGQHFLIDEGILARIVEAGGVTLNDHVIEIGPGFGVLTRELLKRAGHVTAIEWDRRFPPVIHGFTGSPKNLTVVNANALAVPLPTGRYKIVANIPYHITSPLLRHAFLESQCPPQSLTLLIQREVAEKICDEHERGLLTIVVALFGHAQIKGYVPPSAFLPPPKVDSAILHIASHPQPLADAATVSRVLQLVKIGFSQKRKMLRNTIGFLPEGKEILEHAGIDPSRRPQTLSVEEWIALAKANVPHTDGTELTAAESEL